jgi:hypothetical protein
MGRCGPPELKSQYQQLQSNGQHADFIMSKRLLRICKDLMRRATVYRPKQLLDPQTQDAELSAYYLALWKQMIVKWLGRVEGKALTDPRYPLGQWHQMVEQLYRISLPVPKSKPGKAT